MSRTLKYTTGGRELVLLDAFSVPCTCSGTVTIGFEGVARDPAVLHTVTTCQKFDELEADDFVVYLRQAMQS